jgi:amino acid transporter
VFQASAYSLHLHSIFGIVITAGGGPVDGYIGGRYWSNPGMFNNGFKGFCSVLVTAAFSFAGTELVGLTAAETPNPAKSLPSAIKQVFWRITIFYIAALCMISLLVPYTDPHLQLTGSATAAASPFVIAIKRAGVSALPSIFNAVILIAILSVGNSSVYGSSRTLAALADQGQAPKILGYIDRKGRPLVGIGLACSMGFLAFVVESGDSGTVLEWLLALSGLSTIFTWGSICLAHIRFRKAWAYNGMKTSDLVFEAQFGVFGSWLGLICCILILAAQFWTGAWPVGYEQKNQAEDFFLAYLAAPVVLVFYVSWKIWKQTSIVRVQDMDITTGRRNLDAEELRRQAQEEYKSLPRYKKIGSWLY